MSCITAVNVGRLLQQQGEPTVHDLKVAGYYDVRPARGRWVRSGVISPPMRATFPETLPYASVAGGSPVKSLVWIRHPNGEGVPANHVRWLVPFEGHRKVGVVQTVVVAKSGEYREMDHA